MNYKCLIVAAMVASPLLGGGDSRAAGGVDLGGAGSFTILAETAITTTGTTSIVGNVGISPNAAGSLTGFAQILPAGGAFSTSALVDGKIFAADYAPPTPAKLTVAVADMLAAYLDAAGRAPTVTDLGAGTLTDLTLVPGVYKWGSAVTIPTDLTLEGSANGVWIFQVAGTLDIAAAKQVILRGGAQPKNIFWQVSGAVTLGGASRFKGVILAATNIAMITGAVLDGKALAQTAVTLQSNVVNGGKAVATLVDDTFAIVDSNDPNDNVCEVGGGGGGEHASGTVTGIGTAGAVVTISYATPAPTSHHTSKKVQVKQVKSSTLDVQFDGTSTTGGPVVIEKCSVIGQASGAKSTGLVQVNCKLNTVLPLMSAPEIASAQMAFSSTRKVKFKVNSNGTKGSFTVRCKGDATVIIP